MERCWQIWLTSILLLTSMSACQMQSEMNLRGGFGNSVKSNVAQHVIDPEVGRQEPVIPDHDGQRAEKSLDRYRAEEGEADDERLIQDVGE